MSQRALGIMQAALRWMPTAMLLLIFQQTVGADETSSLDFMKPKGEAKIDPAIPQLQIQLAPSGYVHSVLSRDAKWALTSGDSFVVLWDVSSGKQIRRFEFTQPVHRASFSPDGKTIFAATGDSVSLYDAATGQKLWFQDRVFGYGARLSADGTLMATTLSMAVNHRNVAALWNAKTGKHLRSFVFSQEEWENDKWFRPYQCVFSQDSKRLLVLGAADEAHSGLKAKGYQWSIQGDEPPIRFELAPGYDLWRTDGVYSKDGRKVLLSGNRNVIQELDAMTGKELVRHPIDVWKTSKGIITAIWNHDETQILAANSGHAELLNLDAKSGRVLQTRKPETVEGDAGFILHPGALSADGRTFVISTFNFGGARSLVLGADQEKASSMFRGFSRTSWFVRFAPNGDGIVTALGSMNPIWWDNSTGRCRDIAPPHGVFHPSGFLANGELVGSSHTLELVGRRHDQDGFRKIRAFSDIYPGTFALSADGSKAVVFGTNDHLHFCDLKPNAVVKMVFNKFYWDQLLAISANGRYVVTSRPQQGVVLFDFDTRKIVHEWPEFPCGACCFTPDGKYVFLTCGHWVEKEPHRLVDIASGKTIRSFPREKEVTPGSGVAISPDGSQATVTSRLHVTTYDMADGKELRRLVGHFGPVHQVDYSPDGKFVATAGTDQSVRLWDARSGQEVCKLLRFLDGSWAVVDAHGRFDASNGGNVEGMHWVVNNEPIALAQLKERYYDPGLLAKHLGRSKEPLRKVSALEKVSLFPSAKVDEPSADGKLTLNLANRGGGIGKVQVFVNGKELLADARGPGADSAAKDATLVVDLANAPSLKPGQENTVEVVTWNAEGYLSSRGIQRMYTAKGAMQQEAPQLHAIVVGVSEYANPTLNLRYSAKDAKDIASSLELGAKKLFGADKSHITLLVQDKDGKHQPPTRANIEKAFAAARSAKPGDVFVVYLAGHGVALPGDADQYCYLTSDARTADPAVLSDPAVAGQYSVTGADLTEWIKKVPALKQVMVLDTCAAGAVAKKLTEQRSVSGEQIRAIERLKDRTGFHILMGCASDKVSYEATQFSQGLLTHALLKAMRGAALRENEYVDVGSLFQYAADEVPRLAKNIGGIQKPLIAAPRGSSFDIGRLTTEEKQRVPLASPLPIVLRPLLINPDEGDDNLGLMPRLRQKLADALLQSGSERPTAVYVDSDEMPGAIRPAGTYVVEKGVVRLRINFRRDGATAASAEITGSADNLDALTEAACSALLKKLPK
jgi:WD40 repeat protein/uncharacterized caspase-like protein